MKTINQLVITAGILLSSLTVWADNAAEKASLETYFSWRGTNYEEVIALADENQALRDSVNTLYKNSFAVIDTAGGEYIFQGFITLDGQKPELDKVDTLYISEEAAAYLGEGVMTVKTTFMSLRPKMIDELKKCLGIEAPKRMLPNTKPADPIFGTLPYRVDGINYALSGGVTCLIQKLMRGDDIEITKCILNSDVYFKAAAKLMEAFQTTDIYSKAIAKPLIYEVPLAKAKRLKFLNLETYGRKVTNGNFGTICLDKQFVAMEGVDGLFVPYEKTETTLFCEEVELKDIVAGGAYIFKSKADSVTFALEGEAVTEPANNDHMRGWLKADFVLTGETDSYMLNNNQIIKPEIGSTILKNRAFIDLEDVPNKAAAPARGRMISFSLNGTDAATGLMQNAECTMQSGKMMVNGQLIIIRDGRKFNAQGQEL